MLNSSEWNIRANVSYDPARPLYTTFSESRFDALQGCAIGNVVDYSIKIGKNVYACDWPKLTLPFDHCFINEA